MIYRFGSFELDLATIELRDGGAVQHLEPQVFALLALLIESRDRLVPKDEIIEKVWDGRVVSDAAVASRVKSARQVLGDGGQEQRFIRTIHGRGYRFVAPVRAFRATAEPAIPELATHGTRPSLAILPFQALGDPGRYAALASALPDELITELAHLRWLLVTARGSSFRLRASDADFIQIGQLLRVGYCLSGTIEFTDRQLVVRVELVDTSDGGIVWAERFAGRVDDVHALREELRAGVLTALDLQIPLHEAARARRLVPESLDAWSAYHLGLQHVYRFNRQDNLAAAKLFERAVALDPQFARAHAGLSFVHFQTAFMRYSEDRVQATAAAQRCAERGLELDPMDPFVNFTMGRCYWLKGDLESSLGWLERATDISPNYAQGIYARAWTETLAARAPQGRQHVDLAMRLSPIDPLHYAMLGTRAFTHTLIDEDLEAARWAERAARSPGAHVLIAMIAASAHALAGDQARAAFWTANVRERNPALTREDFLHAFPMQSPRMRARVLQSLATLGF